MPVQSPSLSSISPTWTPPYEVSSADLRRHQLARRAGDQPGEAEFLDLAGRGVRMFAGRHPLVADRLDARYDARAAARQLVQRLLDARLAVAGNDQVRSGVEHSRRRVRDGSLSAPRRRGAAPAGWPRSPPRAARRARWWSPSTVRACGRACPGATARARTGGRIRSKASMRHHGTSATPAAGRARRSS